jgi:hypothetical protein
MREKHCGVAGAGSQSFRNIFDSAFTLPVKVSVEIEHILSGALFLTAR